VTGFNCDYGYDYTLCMSRWQVCSKRRLNWTHHLQKVQKGRKAVATWGVQAVGSVDAHHPVAAVAVAVQWRLVFPMLLWHLPAQWSSHLLQLLLPQQQVLVISLWAHSPPQLCQGVRPPPLFPLQDLGPSHMARTTHSLNRYMDNFASTIYCVVGAGIQGKWTHLTSLCSLRVMVFS